MLVYVGGAGGASVGLDAGSMHVGTAAELRSRSWGYALGHRGAYGAVRPAREVSVRLKSSDRAALDRARRVFDRDVQAGTCGELVYAGEWRTRALVTAASPASIYRDNVSLDLTVVLIDGVWRRRHEVYVPLPSNGAAGGGLDVPYDCPYDLAGPLPPSLVRACEWGESAVGLRIYGPATDPAVTIAGNTYQVLRDVGASERVEVDGVSRSVELVTAAGDRINISADAVRGTGRGCGRYIFEPLPPGESRVEADGSFAFDVIWYDEEGEPPWSPC